MNLREEFTPFDVVGRELMEFWRTWHGPKLKEPDLDLLVKVAIDPRDAQPSGMDRDGLIPGHVGPIWFATRFVMAPDFFLAAIALVRRIWSKDSKRQRLKNFLATESAHFRPHTTGEPKALFDKEISDAFNVGIGLHHDEIATVKDVEQARRDLLKSPHRKLASRVILRKSRKA